MADEPRAAFEGALAEINRQLQASPDDITILFERARLLTRLGRDEAATNAYLSVLRIDATHFGALTNLAALALAGGHRTAALTAYGQAAAAHPGVATAHVNLANLLLADGDLERARSHYAIALSLDETSADAHRGLARVLFAMGDEEQAERHLREGTAREAIVTSPYRGEKEPIRVLLLVSARGGNIPTEQLLDDRAQAISALYVEGWNADIVLPPHDLVFNAIGDADLCEGALARAEEILRCTPAPVINRPEAVRATTRENNAVRLAGEDGIVAPRILRLNKSVLLAAHDLKQHGFAFPVLLRAPGFHTGQHFARVDDPGELSTATQQLPGRDVLAIEYLDARGSDGLSRKYRVMMIGGTLYPLHLAASRSWKVHYFTAAMSENADARAEERTFLERMPETLGPQIMAALHRINALLGLDYAGIDFAVAPNGDLLFFEANATMVMVPPGPDPIWDYRRQPMAQAVDAAKRLLRPA
jgi:hypothetical protein